MACEKSTGWLAIGMALCVAAPSLAVAQSKSNFETPLYRAPSTAGSADETFDKFIDTTPPVGKSAPTAGDDTGVGAFFANSTKTDESLGDSAESGFSGPAVDGPASAAGYGITPNYGASPDPGSADRDQ